MGKILTKEVSEHYKFLESDFQSSYILEKMLNSFKGKESKWYSSETGKQMIQAGGKKMESLRVTALSINYQEHLNYTLEFHENEIQEMVNKLNPFLDSLNNNQVATVTTPLPEFTAVKIIAAIKKCKKARNSQLEDSYLVASSSHLRVGESGVTPASGKTG